MPVPKNIFPPFKRSSAELKRFMSILPNVAATEAVRMFQENFNLEGFSDDKLVKWKPRKRASRSDKRNKKKRNILMQTGNLRRSIRKINVTSTTFTVGTDIKYARVHNEGGEIQHPGGTAYIVIKRNGVNTSVFIRNDHVHKHKNVKRTKAHKITIPQRKYIGPSKRLDRWMVFHISKTLKQILP
jgi:phage gpG-like protein